MSLSNIKLTRKHLNQRVHDLRLYVTASWVSNGHWAFRRNMLHPTLGTPEALATIAPVRDNLDDARLERSAGTCFSSTRAWTITPWQYTPDDGITLRLLSDDKGEWVTIDERYRLAFDLPIGGVMYSDTPSAALRYAMTDFFLMPRGTSAMLPMLPARAVVTPAQGDK